MLKSDEAYGVPYVNLKSNKNYNNNVFKKVYL